MMSTLPRIVVMLAILACASTARAASVTIQWDSSSEDSVAGYAIYYGTVPRQYTHLADVGNHTSHEIGDLETGRTYYFAVVAYNSAGDQSDLSSEVSTTIGSSAPVSLTSLVGSITSTATVGTSIRFTADANGGSGAYQYKWVISKAGIYSVPQTWSPNNTFVWTPTEAGTGYLVSVWVRSAASSVDAPENASSFAGLIYSITGASAAPEPCRRRIRSRCIN